MDKNEIKREIFRALDGGLLGKWVSPATAIRKIPNDHTVEAFEALNELVDDQLIEFKREGGFPLVRYTVYKSLKPQLKVIK